MDTKTFNLDEVIRLLSAVAERVPANEAPFRTYTLDEVAAMTHLSLRGLERKCRAEHIEHIHEGKTRVMTRDQVIKLLRRYATGGDLGSVAQLDDVDAARQASRNGGARRAPRKAVA